jgi:hypothetical protein
VCTTSCRSLDVANLEWVYAQSHQKAELQHSVTGNKSGRRMPA